MAEVGLLLRLWGRRARAGAVYWMRAGGYDPSAAAATRRTYGAFLLLVAAGLVAAAAAQTAGAALAAGAALRGTAIPGAAAAAIPRAVLALQALALAAACAAGPFRPSPAGRAYAAGAGGRAGVLAAASAIRGAAPRIAAWSLAAAAAGAVLGGSIPRALAAGAVAAPLAALTLAAAALAGEAGPGRWLWIVPLVLLPAAARALPAVLLWPGRALAAAAAGGPVWGPAAALALLAAAVLAAAAAAGGRAAPRAQEARPHRAAAARRPRPGLPAAPLRPALRSALFYLRRPLRLPRLLRDAGLCLAGCWLLAAPLPSRPWLAFVVLAAALPPPGSGDGYAADVREPFLRQLIPAGNLRLLVLDAAPPGLLAAAAGIAVWLRFHPAGSAVWIGALLIPALLALGLACQALTPPPSAPGRWRPPFGTVAGICLGLVMLLGATWHRPLAALLLAAALTAGLCWAVAQEP